ncbi:MAG TPA: chitobiase/beta-hexosaminidase C-terminal domain-containing protein [Edaphobacter sp.]|jgi:hypothetical protein|nr:chitobiase/beta-hexosaminidase C-terminal domain-containing protein [Edaphobacter sp.]
MKRILPALLLMLTAQVWAATYPVTDNFSGTGPLSANWTNTIAPSQGYVSILEAGGKAVPFTTGMQGLAIYSGAAFSNDQYSQVKFVTHLAVGSSTGPCVRMDIAGDGVCYLADMGHMYLLLAGGGVAPIGLPCPVPSTGDTIQLSVVGTTYTCTDVTTGVSASGSDSTISTGSPAILIDQRTSAAYALTQFQADCDPTCSTNAAASPLLVFSPPAGTYSTPQMVAISTIPTASIFYTTDGSTPTTSSALYNGPISVTASQNLRAIAVASASAGYTISLPVTYPVTDNFTGTGLLSANWTNTIAPNQDYFPILQASGKAVLSIPGMQGLAIYSGAAFSSDQYSQVKFVTHLAVGSSTGPCVRTDIAGDGVCYIADMGHMYLLLAGGGVASIGPPCPIPSTGDTIQLSVVGTTYTCTDVTTGVSASGSDYTISTGKPAILVDQRTSAAYALTQFQADCNPTCNTSSAATSSLIVFSPPAGNYSTPQMVAIATIPPTSIFYTTDGSTPTTSSALYNGPITVAVSQNVRVIAVASASAAYTISLPVANAVSFGPPGGTFSSAQAVTLTTTTPAATILYTTDGSAPTTSSQIFTGPISVPSSETIQAFAEAPGFRPGTPTSATYTITSPTGNTWYVNGGGGTRYSIYQTTGQCDGLSPNAYPGSGVNRHCAFNDIRYLWTDGSYTTNIKAGPPSWGWIGASGDTYLVDCSGKASCRIGQNGPNAADGFGLAGNPFAAGAPPPISGTPAAHTRVLGINYQSCQTPSAKAHVNGGFGVSAVFSLVGASNVDFACFDITDLSSCGRAGQVNTCNSSLPLSDFATNGITLNNQTTNTSITDVTIHGMASAGMLGATGNGVTVTRVTIAGNAAAGWNMDDGSGTTGSGTLNISYLNVLWNGCAEEYPIAHAVPYSDCTDDSSSGYGDGLGTATVASNPSWFVTIDHSIAANNTQDGFDLLHLRGGTSSVRVSNSLMYGNMGQQLKVGGIGMAYNNQIVGNCNALRQAIPGTPLGYNARLSDFCRASDVPVAIAVGDGGIATQYINNTLYSANSLGMEVTTNGPCTTTCFLQYENNIFIGFVNNAADGYAGGGGLNLPNPILFDSTPILGAPGSKFSNNATFHFRDNWSCPEAAYNEQNAVCADPGLVDETFPLYGFGNMTVAGSNSAVVGHGTPIPFITTDYAGNPRSATAPTIGAFEFVPQ